MTFSNTVLEDSNLMPENRFPCSNSGAASRDMVCIETNRILDSCRDRDCFEDVRVFLTDIGNEIIEHTSSVRVKDSCIAWAFVGIDPVRFNRGFYTPICKPPAQLPSIRG